MLSSAISALLFGGYLAGSSVVATEVIRSGDPITFQNAELGEGASAGLDEALFQREARRTIYVGQEITDANTRAARLVTRNQIVTVKYVSNGLEISTSGRAMGEAALHESVSVMNLQSRQLINGVVQENGWVLVQ